MLASTDRPTGFNLSSVRLNLTHLRLVLLGMSLHRLRRHLKRRWALSCCRFLINRGLNDIHRVVARLFFAGHGLTGLVVIQSGSLMAKTCGLIELFGLREVFFGMRGRQMLASGHGALLVLFFVSISIMQWVMVKQECYGRNI